MRLGIVGKKIGMTQVFGEDGTMVPVTVIDASDCFVSQIKLKEKDGYSAVQVGYGTRKPQNVRKAIAGHYKKAGFAAKSNCRELRFSSDELISELKPGTQLDPSKIFAKGDKVDVVGISKGKGYAGVMKRHNMAGTKASHGVHEFFRHGGSIGMATDPGRVLKNTGMPGQLGSERVTVPNLEVVDIRPEEKILLVKGAVPGAKRSFVLVQMAAKKPVPAERSWA